ncbi:MAG: hypothetical protein A3J62_01700 [Candidatus Buchananbacteria bacterium RIFCSPHIGHO2_02_FULL_38_8]|uniref:Inositolphosphotransferase Aur1/Ipt1 domain-containing protein n=1 Tax=Candidatus Buchananbacteria bacterium RIFCSPHIGHO2_02_FULL_38_8 TaxID=1797538 RepID=A0A1G1Y5G3_9BACT|nr:MAG: hypothetical protein A3J62_01700 [Candidatus Buchananbacteria bacterium RIFCSPHIGHO2_02_FULL_38_8]
MILLIELAAILGFIVSVCLIKIFGLHYYFPDFTTFNFILKHYLGPLFFALVIMVIVFFWQSKRKQAAIQKLVKFMPLRLFIPFAVIIYLHFNFKLWAQILNHFLFDDFYLSLDQKFQPLLDFFDFFYYFAGLNLVSNLNLYHSLFVFMFAFSFILASLNKDRTVIIKIVTATALVLLIGGIAYSFAPAIGPFIYRDGLSNTDALFQQKMLNSYQDFVASQGQNYQKENFVNAIAAMPSLHIANALVFVYFAYYYFRHFFPVFLIIFIFLVIEALVLRWHYLIDIPAGVAVAMLSIFLANKYFILDFGKNAVQPKTIKD